MITYLVNLENLQTQFLEPYSSSDIGALLELSMGGYGVLKMAFLYNWIDTLQICVGYSHRVIDKQSLEVHLSTF